MPSVLCQWLPWWHPSRRSLFSCLNWRPLRPDPQPLSWVFPLPFSFLDSCLPFFWFTLWLYWITSSSSSVRSYGWYNSRRYCDDQLSTCLFSELFCSNNCSLGLAHSWHVRPPFTVILSIPFPPSVTHFLCSAFHIFLLIYIFVLVAS